MLSPASLCSLFFIKLADDTVWVLPIGQERMKRNLPQTTRWHYFKSCLQVLDQFSVHVQVNSYQQGLYELTWYHCSSITALVPIYMHVDNNVQKVKKTLYRSSLYLPQFETWCHPLGNYSSLPAITSEVL